MLAVCIGLMIGRVCGGGWVGMVGIEEREVEDGELLKELETDHALCGGLDDGVRGHIFLHVELFEHLSFVALKWFFFSALPS